jgi:cell pole-organizing protein PopZ
MSVEDTQQDQSMEEILQSIKRIISEDGDDASQDMKNALANDDHVAGSDILELTDMLDEDSSEGASIEELIDDATGVAKAEATEDDAADVLEMLSQIMAQAGDSSKEDVSDSEPAQQPKPKMEKVVDTSFEDEDTLVSDNVVDDAAGAFAALVNAVGQEVEAKTPKDMPPVRSGNTVEDLVIESLRPMLREWLDDNLSQLVKRLVQREIEKIAAHRNF